MKAHIVFLFFILSYNHVLAQQRKVIPIVENEVHQLNGGVRAGFGGRSRITLPITIPQNTIALVYTVRANRQGLSVEDDFNLAESLMSYLGGSIPIVAAASKIHVPSSTQTADAYLLQTGNDRQYFENKLDTKWRYFQDYSRQACQSCTVVIPCNANNWSQEIYLGLRNPSALDAITVKVSIAAVVLDN